ncbi:hypothetical protein L345_04053, partial [Ophiophagus hannah]
MFGHETFCCGPPAACGEVAESDSGEEHWPVRESGKDLEEGPPGSYVLTLEPPESDSSEAEEQGEPVPSALVHRAARRQEQLRQKGNLGCQEIQEILEPHVAQDYLGNLGCPLKHQIQESLKEKNKELFKIELLRFPKHDKTNGFGYLAVLLVQGYLVNPSAHLVQDLLDILGHRLFLGYLLHLQKPLRSWQQILESGEGLDEGSASDTEMGPGPSENYLLTLELPESDISEAEEQGELVPSAHLHRAARRQESPTPPEIPRDSPWSPEKGKTITRFLSQQF